MIFSFHEMPDENLVAFIQGGNISAFETLVNRHHRRFFRLVYRWVLHQQDAEDIVQEAFLKLWSGKAKWRADKKTRFVTWFYRILYHQSIDLLRTRKRAMAELVEDIPDTTAAADATLAQRQQQQILREILLDLPEQQRIAVQSFYYEDLPQKQIAQLMGISIKALESLLSRAKVTIRERMAPHAA